MKFEFIGKNIVVTDAMKEKIEKKLASLSKYVLIDDDTVVRVVARVYPKTQKVEITIPTKIGLLRAEVEHEDYYAAVDLAIDKLEDQIRKQKTRLSKKHREHLAKAFVEEIEVEEEEQDIPVKTKNIAVETLSLDDAIMQMELIGHNFFIYRDEESGQIAVVYRRKNGGYGLIETE